MSDPAKAVFLSYAREDADAARRIADALRSHGVEVWFDQSELRGGDAWDAKIRKQIDACSLFVPIISKNTQERGKGYFRLEWKLAVEQTHLMAEGMAFLAPVVIDETSESGALVPPEFMRVQWTRLPGALPTPQFVEQVKRLVSAPSKSVSSGSREAFGPGAERAETPARSAAAQGISGWTWGALVAVIVAIAAAVVVSSRKPAPAPTPALEPKTAPVEAKPAAPAIAPVNDKSIAVLPFTNMSEEKDSAFFTDGIHEDILTHLALIQELKVISRTTVMQYRDSKKSLRQIGEELGVAYILEGSVRRAGNKVRVTGQLINARTDEHVWAKAYDRDLTDIFAIQAELATEIAGSLQAALSPQTQKFIELRPTENLAAYDLFLKGRDTRNASPSGEAAGLREAQGYLEQAVALDPNFATAWGSLAEVHAQFAFWWIDATPQRLALADAAIGHAVRLAPDSPDVIRSLGTYAYYAYRDYARATEQYEKIARLQPNDPTVALSLGLILRRQGHWTDSLVYLRKAVELDPGNANAVRSLLQSFSAGRHYDEYIAAQRRLIILLPEHQLRQQLGLFLAQAKAFDLTAEAETWLAGLTIEQREQPRVIAFRKFLASWKNDYAEYRRLDAQQPFFDEDGAEHFDQAEAAAEVYAAHGDMTAARARLAGFPEELRARIEREPANALFTGELALMEALLGHPDEAVRLARHSVDLLPESRDAVDGPVQAAILADVYAWTGDKDRAMEVLSHLVRVPCAYLSLPSIRHDGMLLPLRGDPRFEALLNDPKNKAPLF